MTTETTIQQLSNEYGSLKNDMTKISLLVDRLDVTIEKLTEVSSNVSQLLAIQGSRLEFQERIQQQFRETLEKRRLETDQAIVKLHEKVDKNKESIDDRVESIEDSILNKIDDIKKILTDNHDAQNQRITKIETWMWLIMGGSIAVAFILNKIDLGVLF